jgi:hypothetical protein
MTTDLLVRRIRGGVRLDEEINRPVKVKEICLDQYVVPPSGHLIKNLQAVS